MPHWWHEWFGEPAVQARELTSKEKIMIILALIMLCWVIAAALILGAFKLITWVF